MYAHTPNTLGQWHELNQHLRTVAESAACFAQDFAGAEVAYLAGLWHDLGKFDPRFQSYLRAQAEGRRHPHVRHAYLGALLAFSALSGHRWEEVVLPIAGHHAGLPSRATLEQQMVYLLGQQDEQARVRQLAQIAREQNLLPDRPLRWPNCSSDTRRELFVRMVFSAVVDADYLDTEAHFQPALRDLRRQWPSLQDLWERLRQDQERLMAASTSSMLNSIRREVYEACLTAAELPPGVFRLTVPTGGGKTRSALAFALRHALAHGLRRVVVAIPYTSIIDQTAEVYRQALDEEAVLEHHSQVEPAADEDENQDPNVVRFRLASENWDAPVVVTTTVQLFESLLSNRPSRARRLHNLAKSIIVLDEVQTLPPEILRPTVDVLRALVEDYAASVVLSTATQPALAESPYLGEWAGVEVREIVPDPGRYFQTLRRVEYERRDSPLSWRDLARELASQHQAMVVLNTRRDALALIDELDELGVGDDSFHLSTLLCGAHRRAVLTEVRRRLGAGQRVLLISTQVVEAGVDLDFPLVYRAVGPLDRIVQAAGRCNREGRLEAGRVVIFEPAEGGVPGGPYKAGMEVARVLLFRHPADALNDPAIYREYFARLFADLDLDKHKVQEERAALNYPEVAKRYRLIADDTVPVAVPYGDAEARLAAWLREPTRYTWQRLQPYLVSIFRRDVARLQRSGLLQAETERLFRWLGSYHPRLGLQEVLADPSDLIV